MALEKKSTLQSIQEMFFGTSICREYLKLEKCIGSGFPLLPTPPRPQPEWLAEAGISHPVWSPGACSHQPSPWVQRMVNPTPIHLSPPPTAGWMVAKSSNIIWPSSGGMYEANRWQVTLSSCSDRKRKRVWSLCPCSKPHHPIFFLVHKAWTKRSFSDNVFFK